MPERRDSRRLASCWCKRSPRGQLRQGANPGWVAEDLATALAMAAIGPGLCPWLLRVGQLPFILGFVHQTEAGALIGGDAPGMTLFIGEDPKRPVFVVEGHKGRGSGVHHWESGGTVESAPTVEGLAFGRPALLAVAGVSRGGTGPAITSSKVLSWSRRPSAPCGCSTPSWPATRRRRYCRRGL